MKFRITLLLLLISGIPALSEDEMPRAGVTTPVQDVIEENPYTSEDTQGWELALAEFCRRPMAEIDDAKAMHCGADRHLNSALSGLSCFERVSLAMYTGTGCYQNFNTVYREQAQTIRQRRMRDEWLLLSTLEGALLKLPNVPRSTVCYRGQQLAGFSRELREQYRMGGVIRFDSPTSTSLNRATAEHFSFGTNPSLLTFRPCPGKDISSISRYVGEEEVLLPPNTCGRITGETLVDGRREFEVEPVACPRRRAQ